MRYKGFTLTELVIAAAIASILAGLTASSYISVQRLVARGENDLVAAQTARVVIDRISRDLRQALKIVDSIPPDAVDGLTNLTFEDGHDVDPAGPTYITYMLDGTSVQRTRHYYYRADNPSQRLPYNAGVVGQNGFSEAVIEGEDYVIADDVANLRFYGSERLISIDTDITVQGAGVQSYHSAVAKRN